MGGEGGVGVSGCSDVVKVKRMEWRRGGGGGRWRIRSREVLLLRFSSGTDVVKGQRKS